MKLTQARREELYSQVVLTIENDFEWFDKVKPELPVGDFVNATWRRLTHLCPKYKSITTSEWAYVLYELTRSRDIDVKNRDDWSKYITTYRYWEGAWEELLHPEHKAVVWCTAAYASNCNCNAKNQGTSYTYKDQVLLWNMFLAECTPLNIAQRLERTVTGICRKLASMGALRWNETAGGWVTTGKTSDPVITGKIPTLKLFETEAEIRINLGNTAKCFANLSENLSQPSKENEMITIIITTAFETRHYVFGNEVSAMSEAQLIDAIKRVEGEITELKSVKTKSKHIASKIKELEDMLAKIVEVLDKE